MTYDAILRNGLLVDPQNGVESICDVALRDGKVECVEPTIRGSARREHDLSGKVVIPGIIDCHVHLSPWLGGAAGHRMLALAGVTTALDLAGPAAGVVELAAAHGMGLNVGCLNYVRPGHTVTGVDPTKAELSDMLSASLKAGALGTKILGGHFPLTPDACARVISVAADRGAHVAFHAGTLQRPAPTVETMVEACELAAGNPLHMPHVNSYVRKGGVRDAETAIQALGEHPRIWSESYLAPMNAASGECSNGVPDSLVCRAGVALKGFTPDEAGLKASIEAGWTLVHKEVNGAKVLVTGPEGLAAWIAAESHIGVSFMVNPPEPRMHLVTAKRASGAFAIDALATDGGGIPRNDIVERGLPLVRLSALTLADFVTKTSATPARMLGLRSKGHLAPGADADITVLDMDTLRPLLAYSNGRLIMENGQLFPGPSRFFTAPEGAAAIRSAGMEPLVVEFGTMLPPR